MPNYRSCRRISNVTLHYLFAVFVCISAFIPTAYGNAVSEDNILTTNGSLDRYMPGSLSNGEFVMNLGPDGSPLFRRASEKDRASRASLGMCNDGWDDRFAGSSGANDYIRSVVSDGAGNIYVAGDFTMIGGVAANRVAKWDGSSWSPLGSGMNDDVIVLEMSGTDLYAAGYFTAADGNTNARRIARWNGSGWQPLGTGLQGNVVYDMTVSGSNVYVSGFALLFDLGHMVVKWDGAAWSRVGGRFNTMPWTMASSGADVYVGGNFTDINGAPITRLAKMNGNNWAPVGGGVDGFVRELRMSGSDLYVGGEFSMVGTTPANRIAKWNGTNWTTFDTGMNDRVNAIAISGSTVYAGGAFTTAGGTTVNHIAKWDGANWQPIDGGTNSGLPTPAGVWTIGISGTDVYAGGYFTTTGCRDAMHFGRYYNQRFIGGAPLSDLAGGGDWFDPANWSNGSVPAAASGATIAADASITSADATVGELRIDEGRTLTIAAGRTLTVTKNLNLLGSITGGGTVVVSNCAPSAVTRDTAATGTIRTTLVRCVSGAGTFDFPVGTLSGYSPVQLTNVIGSGNVSIIANDGTYTAAAANLPTNRLARWWQIDNPGGGITETDLVFNYRDTDINGIEADYRAYRISGGLASQMPGSVNTAANSVTAADITQFSDWTLAQAPPSAAEVSVSGRVTTADGHGIRNAVLTLTASNGNSMTARTGSFGYYRIDDVTTGENYVLTVSAKRYVFLEPSRIISVNESIGDADFRAEQNFLLR